MDHQRAVAEEVRPWGRVLVRYPVFALIALVAALFVHTTLGSLLLVLAVGGTMTWLGFTGRAGKRQAMRRLPSEAIWWAVPVLFLTLVELYSFLQNQWVGFPTISLLILPMVEHYPARAALYFVWLVGFWGLARR
jgi:hypothetical protein